MWFILIMAVVGGIIGFVFEYKRFKSISDSVINAVFAIFAAFILSVIISLIVSCFGNVEYNLEKTEPIISIEMGSEINGSFVLGNSNIKGSPKYYFYKQDNMGIKLESLYAENVYIREDSQYPVVEKYVPYYTDRIIDFFSINGNSCKYIIRVPEKTIINEISLDNN